MPKKSKKNKEAKGSPGNLPHKFEVTEVHVGDCGHLTNVLTCSDCGKTKHRLAPNVTYAGNRRRGH